MNNILVVYYSRTGITKSVAESISNILKCDMEEICDTKKRSGILGFIRSGYEAAKRKLPDIKEIEKDPAKYDHVVIGTPVWANNISSPVRTYVFKNKDRFKGVSFFTTQGSKGETIVFNELGEICEKAPVAILKLRKVEVKKNKNNEKIEKFTSTIREKFNN